MAISVAFLVDFGASRVKFVLWDIQSQRVLCSSEAITPQPFNKGIGLLGEVEIPAEAYWQVLEHAIKELVSKYENLDILGMWLCCEMHGFMLSDMDGIPKTGYISWRDQRACRDYDNNGLTTYEALLTNSGIFRSLTGMRLRPGLPAVTMKSLVKQKLLPTGQIRFLTLADWLLVRGGCLNPKTDITLAAGTGFININKRSWDDELIKMANVDSKYCIFDEIIDDYSFPLGAIEIAGRTIEIFGGLGDFQAALMGAGFSEVADAIINLGTGSQVAVKGLDIPDCDFEMRPAPFNGEFRTFTHIPSGRALSAVAGLFDGAATQSGGKPIFWKIWSELTTDEVLSSSVTADLNIFDAAWQFDSKAGWLTLREEHLSIREVIAGIANSWLNQYLTALDYLDTDCLYSLVVVSGGLARHGQFVLPVLASLDHKRKFQFPNLITGEETLDGLLRMVRIN